MHMCVYIYQMGYNGILVQQSQYSPPLPLQNIVLLVSWLRLTLPLVGRYKKPAARSRSPSKVG